MKTPFTSEIFRNWLTTEVRNQSVSDALNLLDGWAVLQTKFYHTFGVTYRELKADFDLLYLLGAGRNTVLGKMAERAINQR